MSNLDGALSTLAFCWRIERRDGVALGMTSHDRDLVVEGFRYRAAPGMRPAAVKAGIGVEAGDVEVAGALTGDAISAVDLGAGRWDGAAVALRLTQWETPGTPWLLLAAGTLGAVTRTDAGFEAELAGLAQALRGPVGPATSPGCRAMLGDRECRVDLAGRRRRVVVSAVEEDVASVAGLVAGDFAFGTLRWLEGANAGLVQAVVDNDAGSVTLADPPAFVVAAGTAALLVEGCDRRLATCAGRFGNAVNFRGEALLPGTDLLTRYPGA